MTSTLVRGEPETSEAPPSLTSRLFTIRTLASIGLAVVIVGVAIWRAQINWGAAWDNIRHANLFIYLAALAVYYASFVVRSIRWHVLLGNAGEDRPYAARLIGIVITSFFVNCVVPAKMGDIYRAYLAKQKLDVPGEQGARNDHRRAADRPHRAHVTVARGWSSGVPHQGTGHSHPLCRDRRASSASPASA